MSSMTPSYGAYLQLERLLSAQEPPDFSGLESGADPASRTRALGHHDELLFIVVHQVYELWFRLILHELSLARDLLGRRIGDPRPAHVPEEDIPRIVAAVQRVNEIMRLAVDQFRVMETMNPTSFLVFRDLIIPASGFESVQFRELEILAGLPEELRVDYVGANYESELSSREHRQLSLRKSEITLKAALLDWLERTPIDRVYPNFARDFIAAFHQYADAQVRHQEANPHLTDAKKAVTKKRVEEQKKLVEAYLEGGDDATSRAHRAFLFLMSYRHQPLLRWPSTLIDVLIEFEQAFRIFRFRHARMVERMIGSRTGTGGSPGVDYLDHTARYKIFGDLLEARNFLLSKELVPAIPNPELLDFRFES